MKSRLDEDDLPPMQSTPRLIRQLSASYIDPITGRLTSDDPNSFQGEARKIR